MNILSITEAEYVAYRLAKETMSWSEPIPEFASRFPNILESCLSAPFQTFGQKPLYHGLIEKASILFYFMIKNHPFQNGNKRIAMAMLFYFLSKDKKWLQVDNQELYNFAKWVASSNPKVKDATVDAINKFFSDHLVNLVI